MKHLLIILSFLITSSSFACYVPMKGEKYDSQIIIQKLKGKNRYRVSVPRFMEDMPNEAEIILAYSDNYPGGVPIYEKYEVMKAFVNNKRLVAEFTVVKKNKRPYIVIMWWPEYTGMCGIQANTGFLDAE